MITVFYYLQREKPVETKYSWYFIACLCIFLLMLEHKQKSQVQLLYSTLFHST